MNEERKHLETASCLALYDWGGQVDGAVWLSLALNFFERLGIQPNVAVWGSGKTWGKPTTIGRLRTRMRREPRLESIELFLLPEGYQTMMDATAGAMLEDTGIAPHGKRTMVFTVPGSLDLRSGSLRELCKAVAQFCEVRYGIVYEWQKACGPTYYGLGIVQSSQHCHISPIEEEKIGIWFRERIDSRDSAARNRHLSGKLRDVYPLNFLSDVHLNVPLRGMTMREWIESNAGRGSLEKLAGKSWSWTIPSKSLGEIRKCLAQEGLIICEPADESQ